MKDSPGDAMSEGPASEGNPKSENATGKKSNKRLIVILVCLLAVGLIGMLGAGILLVVGGTWLSHEAAVQEQSQPVGFGPYSLNMTLDEFEKIPMPGPAENSNGFPPALDKRIGTDAIQCCILGADMTPFAGNPPTFIFVRSGNSQSYRLLAIHANVYWQNVDVVVAALRKRYGEPQLEQSRDAYGRLKYEWYIGKQRILIRSQGPSPFVPVQFDVKDQYASFTARQVAKEKQATDAETERRETERKAAVQEGDRRYYQNLENEKQKLQDAQAAQDAEEEKKKQRQAHEVAEQIEQLKSRLAEVRKKITEHDKMLLANQAERRKLQAFRWKQEHPGTEYTDEQFEQDEQDDDVGRKLRQQSTDMLKKQEQDALSKLRALGVSDAELAGTSCESSSPKLSR